MGEIPIRQEILRNLRVAYRKLKHYIYYDSTNALLRKQLADFESDPRFERKLSRLSRSLRTYYKTKSADNHLKSLLQEINYWVLPKSFYDPEDKTKKEAEENKVGSFFSNIVFDTNIYIKRPFYLIKAPIEIQIISVLWIVEEGFKLENDLVTPPYGYKLYLKKDKGGIVEGLKLFKPYFKEYQAWRDIAIRKSKELVKGGTNVAIIGLDVKNYFDSLRLNFETLKETLERLFEKPKLNLPLTSLLKEIHFAYYSKRIKNDKYLNIENDLGLPIGLLSSGVLGNWCLREFDKDVKNELSPIYYGRYVDDILIVLPNPQHDEEKGVDFKNNLLEKYFINKGLLNPKDSKNNDFTIGETDLIIQKDKFTLMYFDSSQPVALLDKFEYELRKNSSEFRFLPNEENLDIEFQQAAHSLEYSGSKLKLRSIKDFSNDKFGASKFIAKKIFSSLQADKAKDKATVKQLNLYLKGRRAIEYYHLWEKVLTYFVVTNQIKGIEIFLKNLIKAFDDVDTKRFTKSEWKNKSIEERRKHRILESERNKTITGLKEYVAIAISMAFSLNPKSLSKRPILYDLINKVVPPQTPINVLIENIRKTNLIRHRYVFHPLLNFTKSCTQGKISVVEKNIDFQTMINEDRENSSYDIDNSVFSYSPRFVHFHEIVLYEINQRLHSFTKGKNMKESDIGCNIFYERDDEEKYYLEAAFETFYKINYERDSSFDYDSKKEEDQKKYDKIKAQYFKLSTTEISNPIKLSEISVKGGENLTKLKVGLANIMVHPENMKQSYFKKPIISKKRKEEINSLLNQVSKESYDEKVDLFVLPETSVPYKWLNWLCEHSRRQKLAMVFGLEHWAVNNIAYNFIVTLLPTQVANYNSENEEEGYFNALIPIIRIKNHYSPGEVKELKGYRYNIPIISPNRYDLIKWKGLVFSVFNCFELANISHRSIFRSKVDFLVACEFNRDIGYFSNIVETITRDVHCYFIQSNNSKYGDNRITKPSKTEEKDLLKIKGGKNSTILVDTIDIKSLRNFQLKGHNLQLDDKRFKPTPPGFNVKEIEKRSGLDLNS